MHIQGTVVRVFGQTEPKMLPGREVVLVPVLILVETAASECHLCQRPLNSS